VLPRLLTDAIASGEVARPDGTLRPLVGNVSRDEARRIYEVVRALKPEVSVEIGLAHGVSALAIAQAMHDNDRGVHHVIDPYQSSRWEGVGVANLRRAGLIDRTRVHEAFSEEVLPAIPSVDFAFIDGSHLFDHALVDFVLVDRRLAVGGVIGFHDLWMPSLQKVLRYVLTNRTCPVAPSS
jgi:predicted O-methyltransferase YrrM